MKTLIHKDICTPVFIDTPFTIAKTWKEPSAHQHIHTDWFKKMWYICVYIYIYIYIKGYYTAIKRMKCCHLQQHG